MTSEKDLKNTPKNTCSGFHETAGDPKKGKSIGCMRTHTAPRHLGNPELDMLLLGRHEDAIHNRSVRHDI